MNLENILILKDGTLSDIIEMLNVNSAGIVVMVDNEQHLLGTFTDGDVRRAILQGCEMSDNAGDIINLKDAESPQTPISAPVGTDEATILSLMTEQSLRQIPLVDDNGCVVDLVLLDNLVLEGKEGIAAVLMAGGFGTRLMPMTEDTPKPMLEIGGQPIMERIIGQLRDSGIGRVSVTTHYRPEKISDHFGNGEKFGVGIDYVLEDNPLGTAGALSLIKRPKRPMLVMNGDILTDLNFKVFGDFHTDNDAVMTIAVRSYEHTVPYGVMETDGVIVKGVREKPKNRWMINAGIYVLAPQAFDYIPSGEHFDMPSLMERLIENDLKVVCFPLHEYWRDIGHPQDFTAAENDVKNLQN